MISNFLLYINEKFLYEITISKKSSLVKSSSLIINNWVAKLESHSNRYFANALMRIFNHNIKIELIDSSYLNLTQNYIFVNNVLNLLIVDLNKQLNAHRITKVIKIFFKHFISSSLDLILKVNDEWQRIHDLFYLKIVNFFFVNVYISKT